MTLYVCAMMPSCFTTEFSGMSDWCPGVYVWRERERERERDKREREKEREREYSSVCRFCHHCLIPDGHSCGTENPWGALRGEQGVKKKYCVRSQTELWVFFGENYYLTR